MNIRRFSRLLRSGAGLPRYLRRTITAAEAQRRIQWRMEQREELFLDSAQRLIYNDPKSPYGKLLRWAKIEFADLEIAVRMHGLESALGRLRDEGVYLSLAEFRCSQPIVRPGLTIEPSSWEESSSAREGGIWGRGSGTTSAGAGASYGWTFLEEEAAEELLLHEQHGLSDTPLALWMPAPPGIAGLHNLLLHLKAGRWLDEWFSHTQMPAGRDSLTTRLALTSLQGIGRLSGVRAPKPQHIPHGRAVEIARWMARRGPSPPDLPLLNRLPLLKTYASSAVRVASAALEERIDLHGGVVFTGGEPLTKRRRRYIESCGLAVHPRYVTTESGLVGGACGRVLPGAPDTMHVYQDRIALIEGKTRGRIHGRDLRDLLFTSLSIHTPSVLLNTELGDCGVLDRLPCDCLFGRLGMDTLLSHVSSPEKLTTEGMNLPIDQIRLAVDHLVEQTGGSPDDYQFWKTHDERGVQSLAIVVSPALGEIDENTFVGQILEYMERLDGSAPLAGRLWREADTVQVVRAFPRATKGHKILPVIDDPRTQ